MSTEPIQPLTTTIAYLLSRTDVRDLVGEQVAGRHQFSQVTLPDETPRGWEPGSRALTLRLAGNDGPPDTATCHPQRRVRLEARCYGESPEDAERVWGLLVAVCEATPRTPVDLPDGRTALLYLLWPIEGPFSELDPDLTLDYVRGTLQAHVSSTPV